MTAKIYEFKGRQVRVQPTEQNEPWFLAMDVCKILGLNNTTWAIAGLDDDEKSKVSRTNLGLKPGKPMPIINEYGLYRLVLRSDKQEAKEFQRWVTHEVLPDIRKHGAYFTPSKLVEVLQSPESLTLPIDTHRPPA